MAEVFDAEQVGELGFVRRIAIKRLAGAAAEDALAATRFLDEARIASRLHHANIVGVLDVGLLDGVPFQVLELVDGIDAGTLLQRAGGAGEEQRERGLPAALALLIACDVARALDHAHRAVDDDGRPLGIVHRDVKPANVLVAWTGDVKLGDFGIAIAHDRASRTESGIVGTLGYMAPEQRLGAVVDASADVFALGLTLHALLVGDSPLADPLAELRAISGDPIALSPRLPAELAAVIASVLVRDPAKRPSAGQFADALHAALARIATGDPRTALRTFLAPLHAPPRPAAGALDALLGIELVAEPTAATRAIRDFRTLARPAPAPEPEPEPEPEPAGPAPLAPAPRAPRRTWLAATATIALAIAALVAWQLRAPASPPAPAPTAPIVARVPADAPPVDAPAPDAGAVAVPQPPPPAPRPRPGRPRPAATAPADPAATGGYLQVVGEHLLGARVIVDDGAISGSVPRPIAVPLGRHRVVLVMPDGSRTAPQTIAVDASHTQTRPARLSW